MGVKYTGIRITAAKTRFGSCSAKNSLCFSLYLMCYPTEAVDAVIVHELALTYCTRAIRKDFTRRCKGYADYRERKKNC